MLCCPPSIRIRRWLLARHLQRRSLLSWPSPPSPLHASASVFNCPAGMHYFTPAVCALFQRTTAFHRKLRLRHTRSGDIDTTPAPRFTDLVMSLPEFARRKSEGPKGAVCRTAHPESIYTATNVARIKIVLLIARGQPTNAPLTGS